MQLYFSPPLGNGLNVDLSLSISFFCNSTNRSQQKIGPIRKTISSFPANREKYREFAIFWPAKIELLLSKLQISLENPRQKVRIEQGNNRAVAGNFDS